MSSNHRPRIFDLYCGAGGAAVGYDRAGWEVIGFDIEPQPNYPFKFHLADAIDVLESIRDGGYWYYEVGEPDAFHASPPCQAYGAATNRLVTRDAPRLIEPTRPLLNCFPEIPYVIENVLGAPLLNPVTLCGSSFHLAVKRHRLFESDVFLFGLPCQHPTEKKYPTHARKDKAQLSPFVHIYGTGGGAGKDINLWRWAMDVPWMQTKAEIAEAIPPAYTEWIGAQVMQHVRTKAAA